MKKNANKVQSCQFVYSMSQKGNSICFRNVFKLIRNGFVAVKSNEFCIHGRSVANATVVCALENNDHAADYEIGEYR